MTDPATDRMLRTVTAGIQADEGLAERLLDRLLGPQLAAVRMRLERGGVSAGESPEMVELLYGPLLHRWVLRTGPLTGEWVRRHVARALRCIER